MIERLRGRIAYENPWMTVHEDKVRFPNGDEGIFGVVEKPDFAVIVLNAAEVLQKSAGPDAVRQRLHVLRCHILAGIEIVQVELVERCIDDRCVVRDG